MIRKLGEAQLGSYYWNCSRISRKQVAWELAAPGSPVPESFLCPTWSLFFQQVSWACSYGSWAGIQKKPAVACKKAQHCVTKSLMGKKSPGNSDSGETERLGFNGTHSNSKIKRNRHRKNKRVAVSWSIKVRQRNKAEWEFCTKAEAKDHCFVSINLCTYIPMLLYITFETWTNFDPFHFFTGVLLFWFLSCFVLFLSQIHRSFSFVFSFCFVSWLSLILPLLTPWLPDLPYSVSEWVLYFPSLSYPAYCLFPNLAETKAMKKTLSHLAAWRNNEMPTSTRLEDI